MERERVKSAHLHGKSEVGQRHGVVSDGHHTP